MRSPTPGFTKGFRDHSMSEEEAQIAKGKHALFEWPAFTLAISHFEDDRPKPNVAYLFGWDSHWHF